MEQSPGNETLTKLVIGLASVTMAAVGAAVRALMKHGVQEQTISENKEKIAYLEEQRELHATRIALLERAVLVLEGIGPAVSEMSKVSVKLEALLEQTMHRMDSLEQHGCLRLRSVQKLQMPTDTESKC